MGGRRQRAAHLSKFKFAQEKQMVESIDDIAAYQEFKLSFPETLKKMLISGKTDVEILKKFKNFGAARLVTIIGRGSNSEALAAIKEMLDRLDGKPQVKTENTHKFQKLPDQELDAVLQSQIAAMKALEDRAPDDEDEED